MRTGLVVSKVYCLYIKLSVFWTDLEINSGRRCFYWQVGKPDLPIKRFLRRNKLKFKVFKEVFVFQLATLMSWLRLMALMTRLRLRVIHWIFLFRVVSTFCIQFVQFC